MSLSQTYFVAASARSKLGKEAARPDHNLRRLVGHANLLDTLMIELQDAEREQERWFNQTVSQAQKSDKPAKIQWADTIVEEDDEDSESDSDDEEYTEEDYIMSAAAPLRRIRSPPVLSSGDEEEEYFDDEEDLPELALTRTASNQYSPPTPELVDDSDSEDDLSPPASPPQPIAMDFAVPSFTDKKVRHQGMQVPMIAALA